MGTPVTIHDLGEEVKGDGGLAQAIIDGLKETVVKNDQSPDQDFKYVKHIPTGTLIRCSRSFAVKLNHYSSPPHQVCDLNSATGAACLLSGTVVLYDEKGLILYDQITDQKEYYLFNKELEIFKQYGDEIVSPLFDAPKK